MIRIAILASGSGTNAENIIRYFQGHSLVEVACVVSNKADAYVLQRASGLSVAWQVFSRTDFRDGLPVLHYLRERSVKLIVLAGFLQLIPPALVEAFPCRIINIHPALLPKFGGKGMYGNFVHQAVVDSGETESGITIHLVNEEYDKGDILFQARCAVLPEDTAADVAERVHTLEYEHFPSEIEKFAHTLI